MIAENRLDFNQFNWLSMREALLWSHPVRKFSRLGFTVGNFLLLVPQDRRDSRLDYAFAHPRAEGSHHSSWRER
jgi:hypothetical protein